MPPVISPTQQDWLKTAAGVPTPYAPGLRPPAIATKLPAGSATVGGDVLDASTGPSAAQSAANAQKQALINSIGTSNSNYLDLANQGIGTAANQRNMGILDYLDSAKQNQINIDRQAQQNELARLQGARGVRDMVGQGIQSGGVELANRNASNSSATEALARAYGLLGRQDLSQVGNQYAQGQNAVANAEADFQRANVSKSRDFGLDKTNIVNGIVSTLQQQLAGLNQQAAYVGANPVNIEAEKNQIKQNALNALSKYDQVLSSGLSRIQPASIEANRQGATSLLNAGTAPENAFQYSPVGPAQFQGTGPSPSELPLFTLPNKKQSA